MLAVARTLWRICLFRDGPNHLPYSMSLLFAFLLLNLVVRGFTFGPPSPFLWSLVLVTFCWLTLFLHLVLKWQHKTNRFVQLYTAILGIMLVQVVILRLALMLPDLAYEIISFALLVWGLMVLSHLLRVTLNTTVLLSAILVIGFEVARLFFVYQATSITMQILS